MRIAVIKVVSLRLIVLVKVKIDSELASTGEVEDDPETAAESPLELLLSEEEEVDCVESDGKVEDPDADERSDPLLVGLSLVAVGWD